jgi:hypothetical protein
VRLARPSTRCGEIASTRTPSGWTTSTASGHLERLSHLAGDVVADLGAVGDVVEVPAAGVGHGLEEGLVEVVADPERGRRHASLAQHGHVAGQLIGIGDAPVCQAVGQQEAAVDGTLAEPQRDLFAAGEPTAREVGAATRADGSDARGGVALCGGGGRARLGR